METSLLISTGCCKEAELHKSVYLYFKYSPETFETPYEGRVPTWVVGGHDPSGLTAVADAKCCPFCGAKTPEIELDTERIAIAKIHDSKDGDYCVTCKERNMACSCLPPWFKWRIKK
jgi:hypothetical protein